MSCQFSHADLIRILQPIQYVGNQLNADLKNVGNQPTADLKNVGNQPTADLKNVGNQPTADYSDLLTGISVNSREMAAAEIFLALRGRSHDAHQFCEAAVANGARALIVDHIVDFKRPERNSPVVQYVVADTLVALQALASEWRRRLTACVMAITGSSGKTTTKEFTQQILSGVFRVVSSPLSYNNHWGVPLSILAAPVDTQMLVLEIGMNNPGEIAALTQIAQPDVVVVTMVGTAHIGQLGSQEAIAHEKSQIYWASPKATPVFNLDNPWTTEMRNQMQDFEAWPVRVEFSALQPEARVHLKVQPLDWHQMRVAGHIDGVAGEVVVPVTGRHNANNLMAAASLALAAGVKPGVIWTHLKRCQTSWGRSSLIKARNNTVILFDAYNANPESMAAALTAVAEEASRHPRVLILGEMRELGQYAAEEHRRLGELAAALNPDLIWFTGDHQHEFAAGAEAAGFDKKLIISDIYKKSVAEEVAAMLSPNSRVLVKASRGMQLERVIEDWQRLGLITEATL